MSEIIDIVVGKEALQDLKVLKQELLASKIELIEVTKEATKFQGAFKGVKVPSNYASTLKNITEKTEQLVAAEKEQSRLEKGLIASIAKKEAALESTNRALIKQRYETQQLNKLAKEDAVLTSKLSTFYQKQSVVLNKLVRERQDLVLKQKLGHKLSEQELKDLARLTSAQQKLDKALKSTDESNGRNFRSVGKYQNALKGLRGVLTGLVGAFGIIEGVRMTFDFAKESIATAKAAKGVEFAFNQLGKTGVQAFDNIKKSTRGLISDLEIKTAINEFKNFNISLKETDTLFEFLAVRSAQTGKSVESLQSSLVEGLSKESKLRIDNLGISTADLNAELEKTPNFVQAVANIAKREVAKAGDILDEAANSSERWNVAVENTKLALGNFLTSGNNSALGFFANIVDKIGVGFDKLTDATTTAKNGLNEFLTPLGDILRQLPIVGRFFENTSGKVNTFFKLFFETNAIIQFADLLKRIGATLSGLGASFGVAKREAVDFVKTLAKLGEIEFGLNPVKTFQSAKKVFSEIADEAGKIGGLAGLYYTNAYNRAMQKNIVTPENVTPDDTNLGGDGGANVRVKQISVIEQALERLKQSADLAKQELARLLIDGKIDAEEYSKRFNEIDEASKSLSVSAKDIDFGFEISTEEAKELDIKIQGINESLEEMQWEDALLRGTEFFNSIGDLASTFFDRKMQRIDDEINANDEKYAKLLDNEELTNKQRNGLEAEQERKRLELEKKKREEQKKQATIQKAFDAATVITNTAVGVSKAFAQGGAILGVPFAAIVAAQGAIQLATVLAQPIPQFKDGLEGNYEGWGIVNDQKGNSYKELIQRKDGALEMFSGRDQLTHFNKGDKVIPAAKTDDILRNAMAMAMINDYEKLARAQEKSSTSDIDTKIMKGINEGFKNARIFNNNNFDTSQLAKEIGYNKRNNV